MKEKHPTTSSIVFFDGVCGLCNGFIDFLLRHDRKGHFKVATLQGATARDRLPLSLTEDLQSLVLWTEKGITTKSEAVLVIFNELGGVYKLSKIAYALPRRCRDGLYDWVAKNRYKMFGIKASCRLPTPEERGRFLD